MLWNPGVNSSSTENIEIQGLVQELLSPYDRLFRCSRIVERFSKYFSFGLVIPMFWYIYRMAEVLAVPVFFAMLPAGFVVFIILFFIFRILEGLFAFLGRIAFNKRFTPMNGEARQTAIDVLYSMKRNSLGRKIMESLPEIRMKTYVPKKTYAVDIAPEPLGPSAPAPSPDQTLAAGTGGQDREIEFTPPWDFRPEHIQLEPKKNLNEGKKKRAGIRKFVLLEPKKARPVRTRPRGKTKPPKKEKG